MRSSTLFSTALGATVTNIANAHGDDTYVLKDDLSYNNFFPNFDFFSGPDPTNGFVQYQTKDAAVQSQLVGYFDDTKSIFLGVDYKEKDPKGRKSVRVESTKTWNNGLLIADIRHMPDSTCGSWPAYWLLGQQSVGTDDWPKGGEIDLLEGVNHDSTAAVTLHTSAGCAVDNATSSVQGQVDSQAAAFMGSMSTNNCDVAAEGQDKNVGCSIKAPAPEAKNGMPTYGTEFNNAGGGVYAMEWTFSSISVWFLPRNSSTYTANFASNASTKSLDPSTFGTPLAKFQGQGCDFTERFKNMRIIFDTTFCGDWAGKVWEESTCAAKTGAATCQEYVQNNPEMFADAYWEIAGLKWFEKQGAGQAPAAPPQPPVASSVPISSVTASSALVPSTPVASASASASASSASVSSIAVPFTSVASAPADSTPVSSAPAASVSSASLISGTPSSAAPLPSSGSPSSSAAAAPTAGFGSGYGSGSGGDMGGFVFPTGRAGGAQRRSQQPRYRPRRTFRW